MKFKDVDLHLFDKNQTASNQSHIFFEEKAPNKVSVFIYLQKKLLLLTYGL
jgi:hypothetical protein